MTQPASKRRRNVDAKTEQLLRALKDRPEDPQLILALRDHLGGRNQHRALAKILVWWAGRRARPTDRAEALFEAAQLHRDRLGDARGALTHLREALRQDPSLTAVGQAAESLALELGDDEARAEILLQRADGSPPGPGRAALLRRAAEVQRERLGDPMGALRTLERALVDTKDDPALLTDISDTYELAQNDPRRSERFAIVADARMRLSALRPSNLGIDHLLRTLREMPDHLPTLEHLETLAPGHGRMADLITAWQAFLERAGGLPEARMRRQRLAEALGEQEDLAFRSDADRSGVSILASLEEMGDWEEDDEENIPTAVGNAPKIPAEASLFADFDRAQVRPEEAAADALDAEVDSLLSPPGVSADEELSASAAVGPLDDSFNESPTNPRQPLDVVRPPTDLPDAAYARPLPEEPKAPPPARARSKTFPPPSERPFEVVSEPLADAAPGETEPEAVPAAATPRRPPPRRVRPAPRPGPRAPRAKDEPPPDGTEPALWVEGDDDADDVPLADAPGPLDIPLKALAGGPPDGPIHAEVYSRHGDRYIGTRSLTIPLGRVKVRGTRVKVRLGRHRATVDTPPGSALRVVRAAGGTEQPPMGPIRLDRGDALEIVHGRYMHRVRVTGAGPPVRGIAEPVPWGVLGAGLGIGVAVHGAAVLGLWILAAFSPVQLTVQPAAELREAFAEARLEEPDEPEEPPPPPPPERLAERRAPRPTPPEEQRPQLPQTLRNRLNEIQRNTPRDEPSSERLVSALGGSALGSDSLTIADAVTNIDAVRGPAGVSAATQIGGALAAAGDGPVQIGTGAARDIATAGRGDAANVSRLEARERSGPVRGRVRSVSALSRVSGSLSRQEVLQVLNRHQGRIQACYERGLTRNSGLGGRVTFSWTISPAGRVTGAREQGSTMGSPQVSQCILGVIRRMRFPRPSGGPVQVTFPFMFQRAP